MNNQKIPNTKNICGKLAVGMAKTACVFKEIIQP